MTDKKDVALKLALEALKMCRALIRINIERLVPIESPNPWFSRDVDHAIAAIREALAEQETVLPGGGHVPAVPVAVYGYCPECGGAGVMRERRPNGDDKCTNGHKYPSSKALAEHPAQQQDYWQEEARRYAQNADFWRGKYESATAQQQSAERVEPVAWMWRCKPYCNWPNWSVSLKRPADSGRDGHKRTEGYEDIPLYTPPPASKPWVGLVWGELPEDGHNHDFLRGAAWAESKLREKNA